MAYNLMGASVAKFHPPPESFFPKKQYPITDSAYISHYHLLPCQVRIFEAPSNDTGFGFSG
jgi:hypothetical protein